MAVFNNCLCEIAAENASSLKNMMNLLQPITICVIHSCLVDVWRSQIPYRTVICWRLHFCFISFYPAEGQNQSFARKAVSTNNKRKRKLSA